ncbi:ABC transporter permease [Fulvivirgaceae bacterium PWU4]|uniref:ABC transporter permease n=1 Tax=Chryseosolibacter histidini TaxID=2782349 RepID=A0AAP2GLJ3_9BACT|nr:ABC transporter permease [Chryseosolibacter histidini]MBT1700461.1 ABC transporter permease [Chryseosolibacter histidini]
MYKSYLKIAWRNLLKNKVYSFINVGGLAVGMAVTTLIALWVYDELAYDQYHQNYSRIAQVMQHQTINGEIGTQEANPAQMAEEIRSLYGNDFTYVLQASWNYNHTLTYGNAMFLKPGSYFEPEVTEMLTLKMIHGTRGGLKDMNSILLSESVAATYFGTDDPIGKMMRIDNEVDVKVTGVYEDLPHNTTFSEMKFILPWSLYLNQNKWVREMSDPWGSNYTRTFAQIAEHADIEQLSAKIRDVKINKVSEAEKRYKAVVFLHPMRKWHLYSDFKDGVNAGGRIDNVWLFGTIGCFVLILACINFMNLSTARSEKRAKEVGIRKTIGSIRRQLIAQFFSESVLIAALAFLLSVGLVLLIIPYFNSVADKEITLPWNDLRFWLTGIGFSLVTGMIAGCYPALFLSSFQPVKALKGTFHVGAHASLPRKVLVVLQFTISTTLIIGTIVVYKQIHHAQNRPIGYSKDGLISIGVSDEVHRHFEAVRSELINAGAIVEMAEAGSPTTDVWNTNGGFDWEGKDPGLGVDFPNNAVSYDYGKTIGWQLAEGRDFSRDHASDSSAFILNESAVKFIGLKDPIGKIIRWEGQPYTVIGVVKDLLVQSPYAPVMPSLWHLSPRQENVFLLRINPTANVHDALTTIEQLFRKTNPASPFEATFIDAEYARKFGNEKRIGELSTFFATLAVFISCLGLFGLASFVAEQRTKEIGIRKVLGASVANLWRMLSQDFVVLVMISSVMAIPIAYYLVDRWLQQYEYRTEPSWWVFMLSVLGAVVITLLTVSYQAIRASLMNPVKSLRTE